MVFAALALFLAVEGAEAFCVYNNTDIVVEAEQTEGGNFHKRIGSDRQCCNWKKESCNKGGKRDSIVKFDVYYKISDYRIVPETVYICKDFPIKAGGWLTIEGSKGNYKCEAHFK